MFPVGNKYPCVKRIAPVGKPKPNSPVSVMSWGKCMISQRADTLGERRNQGTSIETRRCWMTTRIHSLPDGDDADKTGLVVDYI